MDERATRLLKTYETLDGEKQNFKTLFEEVGRYILPTKVRTRQTLSPGTRRGAERYDSTGVDAADKLASNMSATVIPRHRKWLTLRFAQDELNEVQTITTWLDECRDVMLKHFASSNFYQVADESFLDLVGFCTDCMFVRAREPSGPYFGGLVFESWAIDEYVFAPGPDGRPDAVFRKFQMSADAAERRFREMPRFRGFGEKVQRALDNKQKPAERYKKFWFLHAIMPRNAERGDQRENPFLYTSEYICVDDKKVLSKGGYHEFPAAITRWRMNSQDAGWGRGPGLNAMSDILSLNEAQRLNFKAWAKDIDPPLVVRHKGVIGQLRTSPSGITYVRQREDIGYLESGGRYDVSRYNKAEVQQAVRWHFYTDQLEKLIGDPQPNMTAYEFSKRVEMMQKLLGPTLGRLEHEKLNRVVYRCFNLLLRGGAFPEPPQELDGVQATLDIEYEGALARAQRMEEAESIERAYMFGGQIAQLTGDPSHLDVLDGDAAMKTASSLFGVPADVLRDPKAIKALRDARAEQAKQQQQMAQAAEIAKMAKDAGQSGLIPAEG